MASDDQKWKVYCMNPGEQFLRLGDMLLHRGTLNERQLKKGLKVSHETRRRIGDVLVELGYVSEIEVADCLAEQYGFSFEEPSNIKPDPAALERLTAEFALKWCCLPVEDGIRFRCVIADPLNVELSDAMSAIARKPVTFSIAPKSSLMRAIRIAYGLPVPLELVKSKGTRKRKPPVPESVMQRDRAMLLDAINFDMNSEHSLRRAG